MRTILGTRVIIGRAAKAERERREQPSPPPRSRLPSRNLILRHSSTVPPIAAAQVNERAMCVRVCMCVVIDAITRFRMQVRA